MGWFVKVGLNRHTLRIQPTPRRIQIRRYAHRSPLKRTLAPIETVGGFEVGGSIGFLAGLEMTRREISRKRRGNKKSRGISPAAFHPLMQIPLFDPSFPRRRESIQTLKPPAAAWRSVQPLPCREGPSSWVRVFPCVRKTKSE